MTLPKCITFCSSVLRKVSSEVAKLRLLGAQCLSVCVCPHVNKRYGLSRNVTLESFLRSECV